MKYAVLRMDPSGDYHLCPVEGPEDIYAVGRQDPAGYRPTNALLPAIRQAQRLGYEDAEGGWW